MSELQIRQNVDPNCDTDFRLQESVRAANMLLSQIRPDEVVPGRLRRLIENDNDLQQFAQFGECAFTGLCVVSDPAGNNRRTDFVDVATGHSDGIWVTRFGSRANGFWGVGLGFVKRSQGTQSEDTCYDLCLAAPHGIFPRSAIDTIFPDSLHFSTLPQLLTESSNDFARQLNTQEFFDKSVRQQRHLNQAVVRHAIRKWKNSLDTRPREPITFVAAKTYAQVFVPSSEPDYQLFDSSGLTLHGTFQTIDSLVGLKLERGEPIRSANDLTEPTAGLCLMVELDDAATAALNSQNRIMLPPKYRVAIPISGQDTEVLFGS